MKFCITFVTGKLMALRVYNTMSRRMEPFEPIHGNRVNMFVCGPTVYDDMHLGHARTYIAYDIIARYLRFKGYSLFFIMNITDVDDKIIQRARETGKSPLGLAREFERSFYKDMAALRIDSVNLFARASEHIQEVIEQVRTLIKKGYAYVTKTGVYFDVSRFHEYGKLSHQKPDELRMHRIEPDPTKRNPQDFSLWKRQKQGELAWESPWGRGRPGWHIEDTAITMAHFGPSYDIHGGAIELIFPHHEAEIAQAEAATKVRPLVKYWAHTGILTVKGEKMAKSLGNFVTVQEALRKYSPEVLRLFFSSTLYRSPIDFSEEGLEQARRGLETLYNALDNLQSLKQAKRPSKGEGRLRRKVLETRERFFKAMDSDFNTPKALATLFDLAGEVNRFMDKHQEISGSLLDEVISAFRELGGIFNILGGKEREPDKKLVPQLIEIIVDIRQGLRKSREWEKADQIRSRLRELGIILEDTEPSTKWKLKQEAPWREGSRGS